jgi:hypothetical protein
LRAEHCSRDALKITRVRRTDYGDSIQRELTAEDTLGEVLLAQGRTTEAIENLKDAIDRSDRDWDGLNETRWDLALADICGARAALGPAEKRKLLQDAMDRFVAIEDDEDAREYSPFGDNHEVLDPMHLGRLCSPKPDEPPLQAPRFVMRQAQYEPGLGCAWSAVTAIVYEDKSPLEGYFLHVWGGGVDERVRNAVDEPRSIQLESPLLEMHAYYYAQLEDGQGQAASAVTSLTTHEEANKGNCSRNWIKLTFERLHD